MIENQARIRYQDDAQFSEWYVINDKEVIFDIGQFLNPKKDITTMGKMKKMIFSTISLE